ncbi:MAG: hypothetical protein AB4372_34785 [Xenococcus sp. (in: cyanobacteria)]
MILGLDTEKIIVQLAIALSTIAHLSIFDCLSDSLQATKAIPSKKKAVTSHPGGFSPSGVRS